ncbi:MAG TPA: response regulator transcription factor [Nitrospira sp.]|nr:response regulator transcription factor [Nitrospira sp.]
MAGTTQRQDRNRQQSRRNDCSHFASRISSPLSPIRILIADGHEVARAGIQALLEETQDVEVVAQVGNADDLFAESRRTKPDIVLLTHGLPGSSDAATCKKLFRSRPAIRIIIMVRDNDVAIFRHAVEAGVQGILRGNTGREDLIKSVRVVGKGDIYLDPEAVEKVLRLLRQQQEAANFPSGLHLLSPQERRIIPLIAEGYTNKEIAEKLTLSDKTVKNYIANMYVKLDIDRRTQAAALYLKAQS